MNFRHLAFLTMFCFTGSILAGCTMQNTSHEDVDNGSGGSDSVDTFIPSNDSSGDPGGCSSYIQEVKWPDGNSTYVVIPSLCDPLYFDKGDPPDDSNILDEIANPVNVFQK